MYEYAEVSREGGYGCPLTAMGGFCHESWAGHWIGWIKLENEVTAENRAC